MPSKITIHLSHYDIMKEGWGSQSAETDLPPWQPGSSSALTQVSLEADQLSDPAEILKQTVSLILYLFATTGCLLQWVVAGVAGFAEVFFSSWPGWPQLLREQDHGGKGGKKEGSGNLSFMLADKI